MSDYKFRVRIGVSKGRDTEGYTVMTARDYNTDIKLASECGGGYDLWNSLICDVLAQRYQTTLRELLKRDPLEGTGNGSHPLYCFNRRKDGTITVQGAAGESITRKLSDLLDVTVTDLKASKDLYIVTVTERTTL